MFGGDGEGGKQMRKIGLRNTKEEDREEANEAMGEREMKKYSSRLRIGNDKYRGKYRVN